MSNNLLGIVPKYLFLIWLIFKTSFLCAQPIPPTQFANHALFEYGGLIRGDTTTKTIFLTFTGGDYNEGTSYIRKVLRQKKILAQFFFTGDFYRLKENQKVIARLRRDGHYLGPHSDKHLLYATWENRDSLLVSRQQFISDLLANYRAMQSFKIKMQESFLSCLLTNGTISKSVTGRLNWVCYSLISRQAPGQTPITLRQIWEENI